MGILDMVKQQQKDKNDAELFREMQKQQDIGLARKQTEQDILSRISRAMPTADSYGQYIQPQGLGDILVSGYNMNNRSI